VQGSLTGISIGVVTPMDKVWRSLQAFGDIAFAYSFSNILIEIQVSSLDPMLCSVFFIQRYCSVSNQDRLFLPGHDQGTTAVGVKGDAESDASQRGDDNHILHAVRVHGVRGVRRRRPG